MGVHIDQAGNDHLAAEIQYLNIGGLFPSQENLPGFDDFAVLDQQIRIAVRLPGGIDQPAAFE